MARRILLSNQKDHIGNADFSPAPRFLFEAILFSGTSALSRIGFVGIMDWGLSARRASVGPQPNLFARMLVLTTSPDMADALLASAPQPGHAPAKPGKPLRALLTYLKKHDITAAPMFPGIADESLKTYFVLHTRDDEHAPPHSKIIEEISTLHGIEGIYWKPDEGLP